MVVLSIWNQIYRQLGYVHGEEPTGFVKEAAKYFRRYGIKEVLDIGTGTGRHPMYLAEQGFAVTGIDNAEYAFALAQRRISRAQSNLRNKVRTKISQSIDKILDSLTRQESDSTQRNYESVNAVRFAQRIKTDISIHLKEGMMIDFETMLASELGARGILYPLNRPMESTATIQENSPLDNYYAGSIKYEVGNMFGLRFADEAFDGVLAHNCFKFSTRSLYQKAVDEAKRVVKKGGIIAVRTTALHPLNANLSQPYEQGTYLNPYFVHRITHLVTELELRMLFSDLKILQLNLHYQPKRKHKFVPDEKLTWDLIAMKPLDYNPKKIIQV